MKTPISFILNGKKVSAEVPSDITLLELLRKEFNLFGAKEGCGYGECGACTVIMNGKAVTSCIILAVQANGKEILTVEGLANPDGELHPLQQAFIDQGAVQCGFCTPGVLLSAKALLDENPNPTEQEIRTGISGNICRCTGYAKIVSAIDEAAQVMSEKKQTSNAAGKEEKSFV